MKKYKDGYLLHFTDTFDLQKKVKLIIQFQELVADNRCAKLDAIETKYTRLQQGMLIIDGSTIKSEHEDKVRDILSDNNGIKCLFEMCEITKIESN